MKDGKCDELYVYKYYLDKGHSFDEMEGWDYNKYVMALSFILMEGEK